MRAYRPKIEDDRVEWRFLTTRDRADLQPILDGYGQYTLREYDEHGVYTGEFAHLLRVFLIDRKRRVRNIYSTGFLHPDILMNDLETLLPESLRLSFHAARGTSRPSRPRPGRAGRRADRRPGVRANQRRAGHQGGAFDESQARGPGGRQGKATSAPTTVPDHAACWTGGEPGRT